MTIIVINKLTLSKILLLQEMKSFNYLIMCQTPVVFDY